MKNNLKPLSFSYTVSAQLWVKVKVEIPSRKNYFVFQTCAPQRIVHRGVHALVILTRLLSSY